MLLWLCVLQLDYQLRFLLVIGDDIAGGLLKTDDSFGFCPNANWNGENLWTFASEFFAFTHHAYTSWKSAPVSSNILSNISEMIRLCHSVNSILNGDSAAAVITLMFIDSHVLRNLLFANSPPLSVRNFPDDPYICIQHIKMALIILSGLFDGMTVVAESLVAWSTRQSNFLLW